MLFAFTFFFKPFQTPQHFVLLIVFCFCHVFSKKGAQSECQLWKCGFGGGVLEGSSVIGLKSYNALTNRRLAGSFKCSIVEFSVTYFFYFCSDKYALSINNEWTRQNRWKGQSEG